MRLPKNRWNLGTLEMQDKSGSVVFGPVSCCGRADNSGAGAHGNPTRDSTKPYGDTPLGVYQVVGLSPVDQHDEHEVRQYGRQEKIVLDPISGDALKSKRNGRYGLLIHGGALSDNGQLRPTYGCIRLGDEDMWGLLVQYRRVRDSGDSADKLLVKLSN